jgi:hypothetical protein
MVLEAHLALAGGRQIELLVRQDFRTTVLMHAHTCDHDHLLEVGSNSV